MFAALFAFSMNNANALTEEECDVTPGMNWDGAACMDADATTPTPAGECTPSSEYSCYAPNQTYQGHKVKYDSKWLGTAKQYVMGELMLKNKKLTHREASDMAHTLRIYGKCSDIRPQYTGTSFNGTPDFSATGEACWCQINVSQKESNWVYVTNDSDCMSSCAYTCAMNLSFNLSSITEPLVKSLR